MSNRSILIGGGMMVAMLVLAPLARAGESEFPAEWFWGNPEQRAKLNEMVGKQAPQLRLASWMNGEVRPQDMRGKIVVVDFWATWCGPCIASIPKNNELHANYQDQGVVFIGVCSSRGQEKMEEIAEEHKIAYPIAKDPGERSAKAWQVMWWPTYGVVDREGKLRAIGLKPNHVEDVVKVLLEEQPATETASAGE